MTGRIHGLQGRSSSPRPRRDAGNALSQEVRCLSVRRVLAANALAALAPDSESVLPILKKMKLDPSEQVREAVTDAIAKIEEGNQ